MSNTPQRPFVPKRTTPERVEPPRAAEFRVVRPFVHGQARTYEDTPEDTPREVAEPRPLGSIADFLALDTPADYTAPEVPSSISDYLAGESQFVSAGYEIGNDSYDFPPIEHFTDTIAEEETPDPYAESLMDPFAASTNRPQADPYGWEETDWQRYDWRSAGALGEAGDQTASSAWAQTDWGPPGSTAKDSRESAAKAIADTLDGIARRIRDGDLVIPPPPASVPDPATIAATLAALLGVRR